MERELTEGTKKMYAITLRKLNGNNDIKINKKGIPNYAFLKDTETILQRISHLKPNTQKSYIITINSVLRDLKGYEKVKKYYFDLMKDMNNAQKENNNIKSEVQKENWIEQEDVDRIYNSLSEKTIPLLRKKKVNEMQWKEILSFVVLSLYVLQAPRRIQDYSLMIYINDLNSIDPNTLKNFNYYNQKDNKFIFYCYKTAGAYNLQEVDVNSKLKEILKMYMKLSPLKNETNPFLLCKYDGSSFNRNDIRNILNKIFDKKISCSMLRNIYLSNRYSTTLNELRNTASSMGTSPSVIQDKYVKLDNNLEDNLLDDI
jgi:hypothetical protein